ncbi:MAG TPA: CHAP domain-containing protein [Candidatus Dormibacteraeota bacterium]|nr:CHAP domain-containing protein [Candidatus Dormibacteraeota bacterium]
MRAAREAAPLKRAVAGALAACAVAVGVFPNPAVGASRQPTTPAAQMAAATAAYQLTQQDLRSVQSSVVELDQRMAEADRQIAAAEQRAIADGQREDALRQEVGEYARSAYQTEGASLSQVLEAHSVAEVWDVLAEARVVAERQRALVEQLDQLRRADEAARDQARAARDALSRQKDQALARVRELEAKLGQLATAVSAAGQVLAGAAAGRVPGNRLPQTTGADGQCTWYAEQAWVTYSDPSAPTLTGDGGDVVSNLARATGRAVELEPQPGSLVSWQRPLMSAYGHVAYVAAVDRDSSGALTGYTVWEMNYTGPFQTDARHVSWTGPSGQVLFLSPPKPVDPIMVELQLPGQ